ncbi:queuosine precursor transporter [Candidatus Falkowbacteria bacterium]|nr:queuosine precursor transporter [Candidatus Falkowbacteria bacterium]
MTKPQKTDLLLALFVGSLMTANFLGGKIVAFNLPSWFAEILNTIFIPLFFIINLVVSIFTSSTILNDNPFLAYNFFNVIHVSVGILVVPLMFLITDMVEEVLGREKTKSFVKAGVITMLVMLVVTLLAVWLPADPTRKYFSQDAYASIFGISIRMMIASIIAFYFAQIHDIWSFNFWKDKTRGRFLWLRNNASTIVSQFLDSTIFMFIAFYALTPKFTVTYIFSLIIPYWIFKILFALIDTPFCYLGVKWLRRTNKTNETNEN